MARVLSFRGVPWPWRLAIGGVAGLCLVMAGVGLIQGPLALTIASLLFMALFIVSAPYIFAGRWKSPEPISTRRPVYRKRRG